MGIMYTRAVGIIEKYINYSWLVLCKIGILFAQLFPMAERHSNNRILTSVPPWIFIGAAIILLPIFTFMTLQTVNRQKENNLRLLKEKGAALIRSFEAGTRTGMMGMRGGGFRLQQLLTETAKQEDIVYLLVADDHGMVVAHNDPEFIDSEYGRELDLAAVSQSKTLHWRIIDGGGGKKVFEIYRKFSPLKRLREMPMGHMMFQRPFGPGQEGADRPDRLERRRRERSERAIRTADLSQQQVIFVGLDMTSIEAAQSADIWHAVIMGVILLLIGTAGIILLFLAQSYRATRMSLSRVQAFSDNLVENMPIGLIALDAEKQIASINYVASQILGEHMPDGAGEEAAHHLPVPLLQLIDGLEPGEDVVAREIDCPVGNEGTIPLEVSASILVDEGQNVYGSVLLLKDLSEIRTLRKEIARNQRLATVGRLAAGVAHEIRNPLSSIKGFATYFKERYREVPEDQHIAGIMIQEVDRLNRVVGQLLEFSRPVSISKKPVQLKQFIQDSLTLIEGQAGNKKIQVDTRFLSNLPSVILDPDRISQVLLNLYLNAIDAMETEGGRLLVEVDFDEGQNRVKMRIQDNGNGIAESDLGNIFDPYFTTKASGTGLGLAIVHKILEVHKGEITVESRPGEGTAVTVLLPYAQEE